MSLASLFPGRLPVLLDGAMGTELRARGWSAREPTVLANLEAPALVRAIHEAHLRAGAAILCTNTFSALMLGDRRCDEAVQAGVDLAREAAGGRARIAGTLAAFGLAVNDPQLQQVVALLVDAGVDLILFETANRVADAAAALELHAGLPRRMPLVLCASTTDGSREDRRRVREVLAVVAASAGRPGAAGGIVAGLNCCRGPHDMLRLLDEGPVDWLKPSTGVPPDRAGDEVMAAFARTAALGGTRFVGGCCGTSPATLAAMAAALAGSARR